MMRPCPIALVVSPDRHVRQIIAASLGDLGCTALRAESADEGLQYAALTRMDVVVVDDSGHQADEDHLVRELRLNDPGIKILHLVEALAVSEADAAGTGNDSYLSKPFRVFELCDVLEDLLDSIPRLLTHPAYH